MLLALTLVFSVGAPVHVFASNPGRDLVIHEIAHVFGIGDEYDGGSMNIRANMPSYGFSGRAMLGHGTERGNNLNIRPGHFYSTPGDGSKIYPRQRPFHVEGRTPLHNVASCMGSGGRGGTSWNMWVTGDIWRHLFFTFTGADRMAADTAPVTVVPPGQPAPETPAEHQHGLDECPYCFGHFALEDVFGLCFGCDVFTILDYEDFEYGDFFCFLCEGIFLLDEETL